MTDRLGEFNSAQVQSKSFSQDIETGYDENTEKELSKFNREAEAIEKVYVWANKSIHTINSAMSDPDALPTVNSQLDTIEQKLDNVRKRLQRISSENKELAKTQHTSPATIRIRVARCTKLANDFMNTVTSLQKVRETHKNVAADAVKQDILRANPNVTEEQAQRALEGSDPAQLEAVMQTDNPQLRHQLEDLRSRNRDIQNLSKSIVQLHQMFTDMSILVEGQQDLINDIEHNVTDVKVETKNAAEELEVALQHQRSARKKKMCIWVTVSTIVLVIVVAVVIYLGVTNGWFSGGSGGSDSDSTGSAPPPEQGTNGTDSGTPPENNNGTTTRIITSYFESPSRSDESFVSDHLK